MLAVLETIAKILVIVPPIITVVVFILLLFQRLVAKIMSIFRNKNKGSGCESEPMGNVGMSGGNE